MEGSEARAILGGQTFLKQIDVPVILMEFHNLASILSSHDRKKYPKNDKILRRVAICSPIDELPRLKRALNLRFVGGGGGVLPIVTRAIILVS